jgi:hypothetical protein
MNNSFTVLTYSLFFLTLLYIVNYILTLSIKCSGDDYIPEKECCEGTWSKFESSVNLTLFLIAIGLIVSFVFFYFYF